MALILELMKIYKLKLEVSFYNTKNEFFINKFNKKMDSQEPLVMIKDILQDIENLKTKVLKFEEKFLTKDQRPTIDEDAIVLKSLEKGLITLDMVDEKYQKNKFIVMKAIESNSENFKYIGENLKDDREIVFLAVVEDGNLILEAKNYFLSDIELLQIAIGDCPQVLRYLSKEILEQVLTESYVIEKLQLDGINLQYMPFEYKVEKKFCTMAIESNWKAYQFCLCQEIIEDRQLALNLVKKDGLILEFFCEEFKKDIEIIIAAITNNKEAKNFISESIKDRIVSAFA